MWGLSADLLALVEEGLAGAIRAGRAPSADVARASFEARQGRSKPYVLDLLGFGRARPFRPADAKLLAERMLLDPADLDPGDPVTPLGLYEVSLLVERTRYAMGGRYRRALVKGMVDPQRCFALMGMATTLRPEEKSLRRILHSAWREDSAAHAAVLVARWPLAIGMAKR